MVALHFPIRSFDEHVEARRAGRQAAQQLGMSNASQTVVAAIISELARNMLQSEGGGTLIIRTEDSNLVIEARDEGSNLEELQRALDSGHPSRDGPGLWLPGIARVADRLELSPSNPNGAVIRVVLAVGRNV